MKEIPDCPSIPVCLCYGESPTDPCVCGITEKALRAWCSLQSMPKMTPEQREWCLSEIDSVEGYSRNDYEQCPDELLANGVLDSWRDYCRDKGLL